MHSRAFIQSRYGNFTPQKFEKNITQEVIQMHNVPKQITVKQAEAIFNIPENTLRAYISRRIIPFRKVRGRVYFVTEKLEEWLSGFDVEPRHPDDDKENE